MGGARGFLAEVELPLLLEVVSCWGGGRGHCTGSFETVGTGLGAESEKKRGVEESNFEFRSHKGLNSNTGFYLSTVEGRSCEINPGVGRTRVVFIVNFFTYQE